MTYVFVKLNYGFSISPRECSNSKRVQSNDQLHKYSRSIQKDSKLKLSSKLKVPILEVRLRLQVQLCISSNLTMTRVLPRVLNSKRHPR